MCVCTGLAYNVNEEIFTGRSEQLAVMTETQRTNRPAGVKVEEGNKGKEKNEQINVIC